MPGSPPRNGTDKPKSGANSPKAPEHNMPLKTRTKSCTSSPRLVAAALKANKAVELRLAGATFQRIAKELRLSNASAARAALLRGLAAIPTEGAKQLKKIENQRLQRLWEAAYPYAVADSPDLAFIDRCLKISAAVRELNGLSPAKTLVQNNQTASYCRLVVRTDKPPETIEGQVIPPELPEADGAEEKGENRHFRDADGPQAHPNFVASDAVTSVKTQCSDTTAKSATP